MGTAGVEMKLLLIAATMAATQISVKDREAYDLLDEQIGIHAYNLVCGGTKFAVPTYADKVVTEAQRKAYLSTGAFDASLKRWFQFINKSGCQTAAKHWTQRGVL